MTKKAIKNGLLSLSILGLAFITPVWADDTPLPEKSPDRDPRGVFNLQLDNDLFAGTDRHYTNGIRLSYLSAEHAMPDFIMNAAGELPMVPKDALTRWEVSLGQGMFTPANTQLKAPQPYDRPYAGWLYIGVGAIADTPISETTSRLDMVELDLGMVGPAAFAGESQDLVHRVRSLQRPKGWDNQIHNEPGIILRWERQWRYSYSLGSLFDYQPAPALTNGWGVDVMPRIGASLGNVATHASVGATVRFGEDLPNDYGAPRIRPSLPGAGFFNPRDDFGWYLFAGLESRLVGRNIFLDGNTFRDSASIDKKPFVWEAQAGMAMTWGRTRMTYTWVMRSEEFKGQNGKDQFAGVSLSWRF